MIKRVRLYMIESRMRSLQRVRNNAEKSGWPSVISEVDEHLRVLRLRKFELEG